MSKLWVPNVNVEGSNPFTRSFAPSLPDGVFFAFHCRRSRGRTIIYSVSA
jgi:hypothetical protein